MAPPGSLAGGVATIDYEQLCRTVWHHRQTTCLILYGGYALLLVLLHQIRRLAWGSDRLQVIFWETPIVAILLFCAMVSTHALAYTHLQLRRTSHTSRLAKLPLLTRDTTWQIVAVYLFTTFLLRSAYNRLTNTTTTESTYGFLHPQSFTTGVHYLVLGTVYGIRTVWTERFHLRFPTFPQSRFFALKGRLPTVFTRAFRFALNYLGWWWPIYLVVMPMAYRALARFISFATVIPTDAGTPAWSVVTFFHAWLSTLFLTLCWEGQLAIFETIFSAPVDLSAQSMDRNACLAKGLGLRTSALAQHYAFFELARLARFTSRQRIAVYQDIDRTETMWHTYSHHCLTILREAMQALCEKNAWVRATSSTSDKLSAGANQPTVTSTVVQRPLAKPVPTLKSTTMQDKPNKLQAAIPLPFALLGNRPKSMDGYLFNAAISALKQTTTGRQLILSLANDASIALFSDFQLQVWAIQALGDLVFHSLQEDPYGSVQRDVPKVIECLLEYLALLDKFCRDPYYYQIVKNSGPEHSALTDLLRNSPHQYAHRQAYALVQELQTTVYRIVTAFYEHFDQYKFKPECTKRLQQFVNFEV
ncbi:Nuclear pore complex subunit [Dispira simplex]|nr:Nuclear pore complex subunit [Dispira simplex]